jgi:Zn-dependent M28 family amino/carboxypeptidase
MYARNPATKWVHPNGDVKDARPEIRNAAILNMEAGKKLFALAKMDIQVIFDDIANNKKLVGKVMGLTAKASVKSTHSETQSPNVIGVLEGADPVLKNEYVILTAHSDHIGISQYSVKKDKINNGAMDNASGVSTLLEIAYELHSAKKRPKRSIIFAFVTGEEKGLLGSDYYAHYPTVPIKQIVANVNLDMPILTYRTGEMVAFGAQHSSLKSSVTQALNQHQIKLVPDPMPEQAIFVRSDQYSLVKKGVPAVYLKPGAKESGSNKEMVSQDVFRKLHYHQPSDDLNLPIDYEWAAKFVDINLAIAESIANTEQTPAWNEDSFFKTFSQ